VCTFLGLALLVVVTMWQNWPDFVPIGSFFALLFLLSLPWAVRGMREQAAKHRSQEGRCLKCGYDLRASPGRCRECGAKVSGKVSS
jgi:hypothetical protein